MLSANTADVSRNAERSKCYGDHGVSVKVQLYPPQDKRYKLHQRQPRRAIF